MFFCIFAACLKIILIITRITGQMWLSLQKTIFTAWWFSASSNVCTLSIFLSFLLSAMDLSFKFRSIIIAVAKISIGYFHLTRLKKSPNHEHWDTTYFSLFWRYSFWSNMVNSKPLKLEWPFSRGTGGFMSKVFTNTDRTHIPEFMCSYLKMPFIGGGNGMNETGT